uniref:Equilibrative nucleoside transporter 3 n=1 Tax=Parascaris univalens TaxID=6257 RepID=A0A914ZYS4_PARUN
MHFIVTSCSCISTATSTATAAGASLLPVAAGKIQLLPPLLTSIQLYSLMFVLLLVFANTPTSGINMVNLLALNDMTATATL